MKSNPNIDCFFYMGNPDMETDFAIGEDTIYVKIGDTLDTVYEKFMLTLKAVQPHLHTYDYLFRTNLSSYIDFDLYLTFCASLPKTNTCAAVLGDHKGIRFPSGAGFTMSIDLVNRLIKENPPPVYLDDVTIGKAIANWNIQWIHANRFDLRDGMWLYEHRPTQNEIVFHYRAKTNDRTEDYAALERIYTKSISTYK